MREFLMVLETVAASALTPDRSPISIPFSRPYLAPESIRAVMKTLHSGRLSGGGESTRFCHQQLEALFGDARAFLTGSCTAALEMAALILRIQPGDEVIMPSWTFPSTANAFALRGAVPVFVDVDPATLNIDPARVEQAFTPRTRAVCCVHYAGVAADLSGLLELCRGHGLALIEDAAQAYGAMWRGALLGGVGDLGAFSFHGTKNISSGEGGALIVSRPDLVGLAEISWEKGTDRVRFERGETRGYEWQDLGSSFLPSELTAALLGSQLQRASDLNGERVVRWNRYDALLRALPLVEHLRLPSIPVDCTHNGHIYAVRLVDESRRDKALAALRAAGVDARTHYRALHSSPAGRRYGRSAGPMHHTEQAAAGLIRLPLDAVITETEQAQVVDALSRSL